jgi:hypothetical protein
MREAAATEASLEALSSPHQFKSALDWNLTLRHPQPVNPTKPLTIISGAQTGVDRAALDAALSLGYPCGGWCPTGRRDESGVIPAHYPVKELKNGGFRMRTIQNLMDADGTLILYFGDLEGGTEDTAYRCIKLKRPYRLIDGREIGSERAAELALDFVRNRKLSTLNVAGPRASKCPEGYAYAFQVIHSLLKALE